MSAQILMVCALTDRELQKRRKDFLDKVAESLIDSAEIENGFRFRFPLEDSILQDLAEIIDLERKCCPFLNFSLNLQAGNEFVSLELTGAEGTKEIVRELFKWN